MYSETKQAVQAADSAMQTTADKLTFTPVFPVEVIEIGSIITTDVDDTAGDGFVLKLDKRPEAGSNDNRGDGDLGVMTITNAQAATLANGKVVRSRFLEPKTLLPGEQAVLELTNAAQVGGQAVHFIVYRAKPKYTDDVEIVVNA